MAPSSLCPLNHSRTLPKAQYCSHPGRVVPLSQLYGNVLTDTSRDVSHLTLSPKVMSQLTITPIHQLIPIIYLDYLLHLLLGLFGTFLLHFGHSRS